MKIRMLLAAVVTGVVLVLPFWGTVHASSAAPHRLVMPVPSYVRTAVPQRPMASGAAVSATLTLVPRSSTGLQAAALAAATPGSAAYHHWWQPATLLRHFGPRPRAVAALVGRLRREGFRATDAGWVVKATAPASVWQRVFQLHLATAVHRGRVYRVQATSGREPAWMAGVVAGVDGLTTLPPPSSGSRATGIPVRATKDSHLPPAFVGATAQVSAQSGPFAVTATIPGGTAKPTGQPVHVVLSATLNGLPASSAGVVQGSIAGSTSTGQPVYYASTGSSGSIVLPLWSQFPLSASLQVTVYADVVNGVPASGSQSATLTLPIDTWSGPATLGGLNAAQINSVYHAGNLEAAVSGASPPSIGLYEGQPPSSAMLSALSSFTTANGLAPAQVSTVNVDDGTPGPGTGGEENMDLQAAEATAPGSNLVVYSDPTFNMANTLNTVASQDRVSVFSMSIAFSGLPDLSSLTDALAAEGITVIASSGDWGTIAGCVPNPSQPPAMSPPGVCEPADFPAVTAVGGTDVSVSQSGQAYYTQGWGGAYLSALPSSVEAEVLSQFAASGGGFSQSQSVPSWQQGFVPAGAVGKGVPDVALLADPNVAGIAMYGRSGSSLVGGGTSLGSPLLAGWAAELGAQMGTRLGSMAAGFYALAKAEPSAFTQAVRGDNGAYQIDGQDNSAGTWNPITGLGSPNIDSWAAFVQRGEKANPVLAVPSSPVSYGAPVTVSASWPGTSGATFQYWWQDPRDGVWHSSGAYRTSAYSFTPPVPGTFPVVAYALTSGATPTPTPTQSVTVTSNRPLVAGLAVHYSGSSVEPAGSAVTFTASATDPGGTPEYQFWVHGPNNVWRIAQNFGTQSTLTLSNLAPGSYTVAAYALDQQQVAASAWKQVYGYATVVNVDSSVTLSAPTSGTMGAPLTVSAAAVNLTDPVYQVWVRSPAGTWTQSGAYTHQSSYTFTPATAGTYEVAVYAKDPYAPATSAFAVEAEKTVAVSP